MGAGLVRLRIDLGYDGSGFHGWARQPDLRTVEGTLTTALRTVLRLPEPPTVVVAGRTDAGVHARGQVVHVDVPLTLDLPALTARLGGLLPDDVVVRSVKTAPDGFDARFCALWRRYTYTLCDDPAALDPMRRAFVVMVRPLDVAMMNEASRQLLGEHDFLGYCRPRPGASTVRELQQLEWHRTAAEVVADVRSDAFCHHMVRALVGAVVAVGEGGRAVSWPREVLDARRRDSAVTVMPAHGLVLEEVGYPPDSLLATRAQRTRQLRGPVSTLGAGVAEPASEPGDGDGDHR